MSGAAVAQPLRPFATQRSHVLVLDYIVGLRAWGLILYGALPANLAFLGVVEIKLGTPNELWPLWLLASFLPVFVTFLLVRNRHREWYLTTDYLNTRSVLVTLVIVVSATLISGASGMVRGKYVFSLAGDCLIGVAESYLLGVGSLVLTSTLFITIMTRGGDLPGLPPSAFVALITTLRGKIRQIQASSVWIAYPKNNYESLETLRGIAETLETELQQVVAHPGNNLAKESLKPLNDSVRYFIEALSEVVDAPNGSEVLKQDQWEKYFAAPRNLNDQIRRRKIEDKYNAIQTLRQLRVGGVHG